MCNIDVNIQTRKRPVAFYQVQQILNTKIKQVPAIITENAAQIYVDVNAFKWLDYQIKKLKNTGLQPFNPNEMGSFSDNYSNFTSNKVGSSSIADLCDAKEQNFQFYDNGKLPDDNYLNSNVQLKDGEFKKGFLTEDNTFSSFDMQNKSNERLQFDNQYAQKNTNGKLDIQIIKEQNRVTGDGDFNNLNRNRNQNNQKGQQQQSIDFTNPNFGFSGQMLENANDDYRSNPKQSIKEKEMENRMEQIMNDRQEMDNAFDSRRRPN